MPVELFPAIASLGAQYCYERDRGLPLYNMSKTIALERLRGRLKKEIVQSSQSSSSSAESLLQTTQTFIILIAISMWFQSYPSIRDALLQDGTSNDTGKATPSPCTNWVSRVRYESMKRTKLIAFAILNLLTIAFDMPPVLILKDKKLVMPCDEEYALADSRQAPPVPERLTAVDVAPLMCAGMTIWNALERGLALIKMVKGGGKGKTVAISGAGGGLGHLGVQFAARLGCRIIAIEAAEKQMAPLKSIVKDLGADGENVVIADAREESAEDVRKRISGATKDSTEADERGVDALLVLPEAQQAFDYGMKWLKDHSRCVTVSFPIGGFRVNPRDIVFRHIALLGVLVGRNHQLRAKLEFAAQHEVKASRRSYTLEDLNRLVEDYHKNEGGKLVVDFAK